MRFISSYRDDEFAEYAFGYGRFDLFEQLVKAHGHELHANPHVARRYEIPETLDNVVAVVALEQHVEVH